MKNLQETGRGDQAAHFKDASAHSLQTVMVLPAALEHICRHRQLGARSTEAGGQLFGYVALDMIKVSKATGPYRYDQRSRVHYRSHPRAAQEAIAAQAKHHLFYLGEWHTHPEDCPIPSSSDLETMGRLMFNSTLNTNALLMLIVGRRPTDFGLSLTLIKTDGFYKWTRVRLDTDRQARPVPSRIE